ncbi:DUF2892 domain-containing protein [Pyxidicoccus parkwayensis]|jgi:hypothetical protein|uniref:DUF2892 domain-containing protein n=1 Tax=Pyxidicoccus parkwayensis TaxID=2813578 RepID=A0ABX7NT80_9BACT|nr:YgaP-like transmembrane domain [Pyxidicoccus parkwaysis]QSQ22091.1 DUF2892 domain-containing protein [Pyxidicoccus parkwaysis]
MVVGFLASRPGRWLRIVTGAGMVLGGLSSGTPRGAAVALAGLGPLLTGMFDVLPLAALFGLPIHGEALRRELGMTEETPLLDGLQRPATRTTPITIH